MNTGNKREKESFIMKNSYSFMNDPLCSYLVRPLYFTTTKAVSKAKPQEVPYSHDGHYWKNEESVLL
jgi:hypothetical protein